MRGFTHETLALSTRNATKAAIASRVNRTAFRTVLRVGHMVPPLGSKIVGPIL